MNARSQAKTGMRPCIRNSDKKYTPIRAGENDVSSDFKHKRYFVLYNVFCVLKKA